MEKTKVIYKGARYDMIECVNTLSGVAGVIVDENGKMLVRPISELTVVVRMPKNKNE